MKDLCLAVTQMRCVWDRDANIAKAETLVREAAAEGANLILLQELFEYPLFGWLTYSVQSFSPILLLRSSHLLQER